jgi:hypothetical protein
MPIFSSSNEIDVENQRFGGTATALCDAREVLEEKRVGNCTGIGSIWDNERQDSKRSEIAQGQARGRNDMALRNVYFRCVGPVAQTLGRRELLKYVLSQIVVVVVVVAVVPNAR